MMHDIDWKAIRPVEKEDLAEIASWYRARKEPFPGVDKTPPQGFILPGVAAGFIITTNTNLSIIEGIISNPAARKADRAQALEKISEMLLTACKMQGKTQVLIMTEIPRMANLAENFGFFKLQNLQVWGKNN